jgi:hypothetical protein
MTTETHMANCPFCEDGGKPFAERVHEPFIGFAVICHACKARGPAAKLDPEETLKRGATWEGYTAPVKEQARQYWNQWEKALQTFGWAGRG